MFSYTSPRLTHQRWSEIPVAFPHVQTDSPNRPRHKVGLRVPASTLLDRLEKLAEMGLVDSKAI